MKPIVGIVALSLSMTAAALPAEWPEAAAHSGDKVISREDLAWYCDALWRPEEQGTMTASELAARLQPLAGDAAERLRLRAVLAADGIAVTPELSQARSRRFEPDLPQEESWNPARQLMLAILAWHMDRFPDSKSYDDAAVEDYYRRNQTRYLVPEHRSVSMILIARSLSDGADQVATLQARLHQGEPFDKLRDEYDHSTEQERWAMLQVPEVKNAVTALDALQPDQTTGVLATERFWVIARAQVLPPYYLPLNAELRNRIRLHLQLLDAMERFDRIHPAAGVPEPLTFPEFPAPNPAS